MSNERSFPIGHRICLPGHFPEPVLLESIRSIGTGYECRVRLANGTPDEAILSLSLSLSLSPRPTRYLAKLGLCPPRWRR